MPRLKSLPESATLLDLFRAYPDVFAPLLRHHEVVLRGPSELSEGQRELIAAYVSALNQCDYCHGVHAQTAKAFGIPDEVLGGLVADPSSAPVDERLRPVLAYARKLTLTPGRLVDADVAAIREAGWSDDAVFHATAVCALFNTMNRLVNGLGIVADDAYFQTAAKRLSGMGYAGMAEQLER